MGSTMFAGTCQNETFKRQDDMLFYERDGRQDRCSLAVHAAYLILSGRFLWCFWVPGLKKQITQRLREPASVQLTSVLGVSYRAIPQSY